MDRNTSSPVTAGLFVAPSGADTRRSFMVNGTAYAREMNRKPEPTVSLPQALLAGICIACFALGVVCLAAGVS